MKRQIDNSTTPPIDWSCCCVCGDDDNGLRLTTDGIKTLAANFLKHWDDEVLAFDSKKVTDKYVNSKPDFFFWGVRWQITLDTTTTVRKSIAIINVIRKYGHCRRKGQSRYH